MRHVIAALFFVLIAAPKVLLAQNAGGTDQDKWKKIVVLQSTREDVERLFGKPKSDSHLPVYDLEGGRLQIDYNIFHNCEGGDFCKTGDDCGWLVPAWTVLEVSYSPDPLPKFSSLNLNLTRFEKDFDTHSHVIYTSNEEGVAYTVFRPRGTLSSIRYFPSSRFNYLRCPKKSKETP